MLIIATLISLVRLNTVLAVPVVLLSDEKAIPELPKNQSGSIYKVDTLGRDREFFQDNQSRKYDHKE